MKIAYVTTYDATNIHAWSGSGYYIPEALKLSGFQVEYIVKLREKCRFPLKLKQLAYRKFANTTFVKDRTPLVLESYAKQVESSLSKLNVDVVFSPGTIPIAHLKTKHPIVFWTDATFAGMIDFYPLFSNLCRESIRDGNRMEQAALSKCNLAIYASEWAAKTALNNYDVDPQKVKVVPFGANISCERNEGDVKEIIKNKDVGTCKLLFIGVEWLRKGGDIALKTAKILNGQGMQTELHVVGCVPPFDVPRFVTLHGYVSKETKRGKEHLDKLFSESHFLILPSRAECYGVVFAEASSYGLPSLATNVGGIPSAVRDAKNGQLFPLAHGAESYANYIKIMMSSKEQYQDLAMSSFKEYSNRINWSSAGKKVRELICEL